MMLRASLMVGALGVSLIARLTITMQRREVMQTGLFKRMENDVTTHCYGTPIEWFDSDQNCFNRENSRGE